MKTVMLKFTPTIHPGIIKKPQIHCTNFPKIHIAHKPFHVSSCKKDADSNSVVAPVLKEVSNSMQTDEVHVSAFKAIEKFAKQVCSSMIKLVVFQGNSFVEENDLIMLEHNGREIVGVVQYVFHHVRSIEVTILREFGSENKLSFETFKVSRSSVINLTLLNEEKDKMWGIHTLVDCKDKDLMKIVGVIKNILNAYDDVKCNAKYNFVAVDSVTPTRKIVVNSFVTCSKLKTPHYKHYMEVRKKVLLEIDEIQSK